MSQGMTSIPANELYADTYILPFKTNVRKTDFELSWQVPADFGRGKMSNFYIRPGMMLSVQNLAPTKDLSISYEIHGKVLCLSSYFFGQAGFSSPSFSLPSYTQAPGNFYTMVVDAHKGRVVIPRQSLSVAVELHVDFALVKTFLDGPYENVWKKLSRLPDCSSFFSYSAAVYPEIQAVYQGILDCPYHSSLKHLYFESKALELLALEFGRLYREFFGTSRKSRFFPTRDKDKIHHVRWILENSIDNPPNLFELAKSVGMSHTKLNILFRKIYGTTVFGYFRTIRLNRAKLLLKEGEMNITEVSYALGYSSPSHFTREFKKHFGSLPNQYLKTYLNTI